VSYDSVTSNVDRLAKIKNFTMFETDLNDNKLPQWMFITPNMSGSSATFSLMILMSTANDGHDSSVTVAAQWARSFLTPLLSNSNFMKNTLVLLSKFSSLVGRLPLTRQPLMNRKTMRTTTEFILFSLEMLSLLHLTGRLIPQHTTITRKWRRWRTTGV
jgi:hypothetical protein